MWCGVNWRWWVCGMLSSLEAQVALVSSWSWAGKNQVLHKAGQQKEAKWEMAGPTSYLIKHRAPAHGSPNHPNTHNHFLEMVSFPGTPKVAAFPWPCTFVYPVFHLSFRFPSECLDTVRWQQASLSLLCLVSWPSTAQLKSQLSSTWLCSQLNQTERPLREPTFLLPVYSNFWDTEFWFSLAVKHSH